MNKKSILILAGLLIVGLSVYILSTGNFTRDTQIIETPSEKMRDPVGIEDPDENDSPMKGAKDSDYTCPEGWINCMPGPRELPEICNDEEYQQWAERNCPDFEGIAY